MHAHTHNVRQVQSSGSSNRKRRVPDDMALVQEESPVSNVAVTVSAVVGALSSSGVSGFPGCFGGGST